MGERPDGRRRGDERAFVHDPTKRLRIWPMPGYPFRWKASQGEPECMGEYVTQFVWGHRIVLYIAVVVTISLVVQLLGPFFLGEEVFV